MYLVVVEQLERITEKIIFYHCFAQKIIIFRDLPKKVLFPSNLPCPPLVSSKFHQMSHG